MALAKIVSPKILESQIIHKKGNINERNCIYKRKDATLSSKKIKNVEKKEMKRATLLCFHVKFSCGFSRS